MVTHEENSIKEMGDKPLPPPKKKSKTHTHTFYHINGHSQKNTYYLRKAHSKRHLVSQKWQNGL